MEISDGTDLGERGGAAVAYIGGMRRCVLVIVSKSVQGRRVGERRGMVRWYVSTTGNWPDMRRLLKLDRL